MNDYITMLGTGNALATRCYNTCFTLHGEKGVLLEDGDKFEAGGFPLQCFDIHSTKERQFGFAAQLSGGRRLCCLGDEP